MSDFDLWSGKSRKDDDDDDGRVPFGRRARLWFALGIRDRLTATDEEHPKPAASGDELEALVAWYGEDPARYVKWEVANEYRGKSCASGCWVLDMDRINDDLAEALDETTRAKLRAIDAERITSLDQWLRADMEDTLEFPGCNGGLMELPAETRAELSTLAYRRRNNWPRACRSCGESFRPKHWKSRRCRSCIEQAKPKALGDTSKASGGS